jgi:hypothetical protein
MSFKGEIKYMTHISQDDPDKFFRCVKQAVDSGDYHDLYVEIQYSTAMQPDGRCLFSALIIGRVRNEREVV